MLFAAEVDAALVAARAHAEALGIAVSVAVLDEGGYLLAVRKGDGCRRLTPQMAINKAYGAVVFERPTAEMTGVPQGIVDAVGRTGLYPPVFVAGGLPILRDGEIVGAIGVSGGTPAQDAECAEAGAAALG